MTESDAVRVQEEPAGRRLARAGGRAVEPITGHRMSDAGEVHADLVGAASTDAHLQQCEAGKAPQDVIFAPGGAALSQTSRHAGTMARIAGDRFFNPAAIGLDNAMHQ